MTFTAQRLLDTTPRWLSITLVSSSSALLISGIGLVLNLLDPFNITPFTLLLHLVWAIVVSSWVLTLKVKLPPEKKALLAIGVAVAVGSMWDAVQQWVAYLETGGSQRHYTCRWRRGYGRGRRTSGLYPIPSEHSRQEV